MLSGVNMFTYWDINFDKTMTELFYFELPLTVDVGNLLKQLSEKKHKDLSSFKSLKHFLPWI